MELKRSQQLKNDFKRKPNEFTLGIDDLKVKNETKRSWFFKASKRKKKYTTLLYLLAKSEMIKNETKNVGVCGETESLQNASHSQEREREEKQKFKHFEMK